MSTDAKHPYQACRDPGCERYACRIWHEAWAEAFREGREEGYETGFVDGIAACPRNHAG